MATTNTGPTGAPAQRKPSLTTFIDAESKAAVNRAAMPAVDAIALTQALIRCPSVTPEDAGVLAVLESALKPLGFTCERLRFEEEGAKPTENLYARLGTARPNFCFAGHTDVVPPGD